MDKKIQSNAQISNNDFNDQQRKRQQTSMTYKEFVKTFDKAPRCPQLKPISQSKQEMLDLDTFKLDLGRPHANTTPVNFQLFKFDEQEYSTQENSRSNLQQVMEDEESTEEGNVDFDDNDSIIGVISKTKEVKNKFNPLLQQQQLQQKQQLKQNNINDNNQINNNENNERCRSQSEKVGSIFSLLERKLERRKQQTVSDQTKYY